MAGKSLFSGIRHLKNAREQFFYNFIFFSILNVRFLHKENLGKNSKLITLKKLNFIEICKKGPPFEKPIAMAVIFLKGVGGTFFFFFSCLLLELKDNKQKKIK